MRHGKNHNDVTTRSSDLAREHLTHADELDCDLDDLVGDGDRSKNAAISDLHREIGTSLKLADIYATLAVAEAIERLRRDLTTRPGDVPLRDARFL